jgi:hypothetical protein
MTKRFEDLLLSDALIESQQLGWLSIDAVVEMLQ